MARDRKLTRVTRVLRASLLSVVAVLVAAMSHMLAGGNTPTLIALVAGSIVALPLVLVFTSTRFRVIRTFISVAVTQALFHWMFSTLGVPNPTGQGGTPLPAHAEHFGLVQSFVPLVPAGSGANVAMWLSHLVAAAMTVWMLRRAETAIDRIWSALKWLLLRGFRQAISLSVAPKPLRISHATPVAADQRAVWRSLSYRGPPRPTGALI